MDRYGLSYAPLLQDTSVIGTQAWPSLTDYSYHLVWFHEAIIRLHTPPASRTTSHTVRSLALPLALSLSLAVCHPGQISLTRPLKILQLAREI